MADTSEWVSFDEDASLALKQTPTLNKPSEQPELLSSDVYISVLENKLKKMRGQDPSKITSKELLESMRQARESHFERLLNNDGQNNTYIQAFITDDKTNANNLCCMNVYTRMFPKQPISTQELECLVDNDDDEK